MLNQNRKPYTLKFGESGTLVDSSIITTFITYDTFLFMKFLLLSPNWHTSVLQALDDYCNPLENTFVAAYHTHLFFKKSFTSSRPIRFCGSSGIRIDRVIECEVADPKEFGLVPKSYDGEYTMKIAY